jgi:hypothetical protein
MRNLGAGDEHEDPDSGCLRPDFAFVKEGAGYLTFAAAAAFEIVSGDPDRFDFSQFSRISSKG